MQTHQFNNMNSELFNLLQTSNPNLFAPSTEVERMNLQASNHITAVAPTNNTVNSVSEATTFANMFQFTPSPAVFLPPSSDDAVLANNLDQVVSCGNGSTTGTTSSATTSVAAAKKNANNKQPKKVIPSTNKAKTLLPEDFEPSDYSIICGNKRKYFNSIGNRRFRVIVKTFLQQYLDAHDKVNKSFVVSKVMNIIRDACPMGAFVTQENGRWYEASERTAREKVGGFFRDLSPNAYRSSAKNKIARRKFQKQWSEAVSAEASCSAKSSLQGEEDGDASIGSSSASFYDVDDLCPVPLED
jgi:hypothetical protein